MTGSHALDKSIYYLLMLYAFSSTISIAASNISISLALCLLLFRYYRKPFAIEFPKGLAIVIGLFFATALVSAIFAYQPLVAFERVWAYLFRMAPLILTVFIVREPKQVTQLMLVLSASIMISDIYAIWQGLHGNYRASAFSSHPMILAGFLLQLIPLFLVFAVEDKKLSYKVRYFLYFVSGLSCLALLFNGTRGAWLAVAFTTIMYAILSLKRNPKRTMVVLLVLVLVVGSVIGLSKILHERMDSITDIAHSANAERVLMWKSAWHMFADHWLLGVGPNNYGELYRSQYILPEAQERGLGHAHNNYLHTMAELGIVGFMTFCLMFGYILYTKYSDASNGQVWGTAVMLVTVSLLIQGVTEYNFGNSAVMRLYWFILGLSYTQAALKNRIDR